MLDLSEKQALAMNILEDDKTTELLFGGGAGGGKSYLGCIWHIGCRMKYPGSRGLIGRAKISTLKESTLVTLMDVARQLGYNSGKHFTYNAQDNTLLWQNGSKTVLKDLFLYPSDPDFISLGSTEYTDAFIDEGTEITQKAFDIVSSRLRWRLKQFKLQPKLLLTCNPSEGWVKERYILNSKNKRVKLQRHQQFIQSLLMDNPDDGFRGLYTTQLERLTSDYDRQRLLHGDWEAHREVISPFIYQYAPEKHESTEAVFSPDKPLMIMVDFNLNPVAVNFAHLWHDERGQHLHFFDELDIRHGSLPELIDRIRARYGNQLSSCRVTGDASGNRGSIEQRDNASNYLQLLRGLGLNSKQLEVPDANPTHDNSRADCNYFFCHFPDVKINPLTCPHTCRDLRTVQADVYNNIIKRNRLDISQQADHLDCVRYAINTWMHPWLNFHQKNGKK